VSDGPILGQDRARTALLRAVGSGHLHHAWIFHGPSGVGKCTTALELARIVLDPSIRPGELTEFRAPRTTETARLVDAGTHPDLCVVRKERAEESSLASLRGRKQTNIPVDLLRELMLGGEVDGRRLDPPVARSAYRGHGKVFVIDEAELLDEVGQNALLKTLEEPPPGTYIILVTTREDRLLPTIRSRCQRVPFGPLDDASMARWLATHPPAKELDPDPEARAWLVRFAEGSPGAFVTAQRHGAHAMARELGPILAALDEGRFEPKLGDRMAEMVEGVAEAIVKENPRASKEAANRLGMRLVFGILARHVRDAMRDAAEDPDEIAWRAGFAAILDAADEAIRRHLNLKQVLANLVAQWTARAERRPRAAGRRR